MSSSSEQSQSQSQLPIGMQDSGRSQMPIASSEPETEPEAAVEEPSLATHPSGEPDPEATVEEPSPAAGQPTDVGPEDEDTAEEPYVTFDSSVELGLESEATVLEPSFVADQHPQPLETNEIDVKSHEEGDSKNTQPIVAEGLNSPPRDVIEEESKNGDAHVEHSNGAVKAALKLANVEGNRTFTMRELLHVMKNGDVTHHDEGDVDTPKSYAASEHQIEQNNAAMDLINSVNPHDEEGRSRQRILTFAAKRYAMALEKNPGDHDALYNWALVLQESADNVSPESTSPSKDALLEEACRKYEEATRLCPSLNDAYYNWAIAISDRAKMRGRTKEAEELWKQATKNYEKAVQLNWNSPQALNNWGLALQELSAIVSAREKHTIVKTAISKFRAAIQLQFDFHRAIYNLGTVLYGLAEDVARIGGFVNTQDVSPDELYSQSAIYIAAAHALKPSYSVYSSALKLVLSMLPLPFLKIGYLTAPPSGSSIAPHSDWKRSHFVLNHETLLQIDDIEQMHSPPGHLPDTSSSKGTIKINIPDIVSVSACADLTLPPGAGLCIDTINETYYMVADSWESLDRWIDAIRLVYTIFARGKTDVLAGVIIA